MAGSTLRSLCLLFLSLGVSLAEITVNVSPTVDVIKGETARLPCSYTISDSSVQTVVQWSIEYGGSRKRVAYRSATDSGVDKSTPLTGRIRMEPNMTLVISDTMPGDELSFFCQVTGGRVGSGEEETKLRVFYTPEKPVVSSNTEIITVADYSSAVGTCTSRNGHPEPRIIWYKDSVPLPMVSDPKEKTYMVPRLIKESSGLFTISSVLYMQVKKEDAKSVFSCTVEYRMPNNVIKQERSDNFKLTLHYPAEHVMFKLVNQDPIKEGDTVEMKCETDGNPQPQFEFYKGTETIQQSETGLLTLKEVTRDSAGQYKCEALDFDSVADLTKVLNISVHHLDPVSIDPAGPLMVRKGETLELQCSTKSPDPYTLVWMKGGKTLSQKGALSQQSVTLADAGEYVCVASVPSVPGLEKRANVTVRIEGTPEIEAPVIAEVKKPGDLVTLRCSALGYPAAQFTWKPSGKESVTVEGHKTISTVTLPATDLVLQHGVMCTATNAHGKDEKTFNVQLKSDDNQESGGRSIAETQQGGSGGVVIAVVVCVLLLLLVVSLLYFLSKKGKMSCGKKDKNNMASEGPQEKDALKSDAQKMEEGNSSH